MLSILIASVPERIRMLERVLTQLSAQTFGKPVEILVLTDNRFMSIGTKRQRLNDLSRGRYIIHVDDDDTVSEDFVDSLMEFILQDRYDCITFTCMVQEHGGKPPRPCYYSSKFPHATFETHVLRKPNPRCCYRRSIALRHPFRDLPFMEDDEWAARACKDIEHEISIPKVLYYYAPVSKPDEWFTAKGTIQLVPVNTVPKDGVIVSKDTLYPSERNDVVITRERSEGSVGTAE